MKIAYGTYAMPMVPLEEALLALAEISYDGVEIAISPRHNTAPDQLDSERRRQLRELLKRLKLEVPALFVLGKVMVEDEREHWGNLQLIRRVAQLARDLDIGPKPVISMGVGGRSAEWMERREELARLLEDYAELASEEGFIFAVEPHVNAIVDRSERAIWLMKKLNNPLVRLHFDIVHFYLAGESIEEAVFKLVPYTAHTHVTDVRRYEEGFEFVPLGQGELNLVRYVRAMDEAGWKGFITIEVSAMVWSKEGYDPFETASNSYRVLKEAFEKAGVAR